MAFLPSASSLVKSWIVQLLTQCPARSVVTGGVKVSTVRWLVSTTLLRVRVAPTTALLQLATLPVDLCGTVSDADTSRVIARVLNKK